MDEHEPPGKPGRRAAGGELIIPVAGVAFTLYYFSTIIDSPWEAQVNAFFVGSILLLLVAIFLIKIGREVATGAADLRIGRLIEPVGLVPKRLALLALAIGYVTLIKWLGFTLTTFGFLAGAMLVLSGGERKGVILGLSAALALIGWLLFVVAFQTRFPAGPVERLLGLLL